MSQRGMAQLDELHSRRTGCDEELTFEFRGVRTGVDYRVQIHAKSLAAARSDSFSTAPGQHAVIDPRLTHGGALARTVRRTEGKPVGGAKLSATVDPVMFNRGGFEVRDGESQADGTYLLDAVAAGKLQIEVKSDGYLEGSRQLELSEGQHAEAVDFALDRGA